MIGDSITLPSSDGLSRVGYTFKGWSTNKNATSGINGSYTIQYSDNTVVASEGALDYNITYYAVWEKNYYPVVYDLNGGTGTVPTTSKTYGIGDKIYELDYGEGLKKAGCFFSGWSTDKNAKHGSITRYTISEYDIKNIKDGAITFYAVWDNGIDITYDDNVSSERITVPTDKNLYKPYESAQVSSTVPIRGGFTFAGWNTESDGSGTTYQAGETFTITEDTTLYAMWKANFCIHSVSASLENNLRLNYIVREEVLDDYKDLSLTLNLNGTETVVSNYTETEGYIIFKFSNIEGKLIASNIKATLSGTKIDGGEKVTAELNYSIKEYCEDLLEAYSDKTYIRSLAVDILNYGAACQIYNKFNTSALANKDLTSAQKAWANTDRSESYVSALNTSNAKSSDGKYAIAGAQMLLEDAINMQIMIYAEDTSGVSLQFWDGSTKIATVSSFSGTVTYNKKTYQVVDFRGLNAYQLSDAITIKLFKGSAEQCSIVYSMESYAAAKVDAESQKGEKEAGVTNLGQLIKAVMAYGDGASEYVGNYLITSTSPYVVSGKNNITYVSADNSSTQTLTFTASDGYVLPSDKDDIEIDNATIDSWSVSSGVGTLVISNITGNVDIYIERTQDGYFLDSSNNYVGTGFTASDLGANASGVKAKIQSNKAKKVVLAEGTTSITSNAFSGLSGITYISVPSDVASIGSGAFNGCSSLATIDFSGTMNEWIAAVGSNAISNSSTKAYTVNCTNGQVDKAGNKIYTPGYYNSDERILKVLTLATTGTDAIGVKDEVPNNTDIISLPDGVTSIGYYAFIGTDISSVVIPNTVERFDSSAFWGCTLTNIYFKGTNAEWKAVLNNSDPNWAEGLNNADEIIVTTFEGVYVEPNVTVVYKDDIESISGVTADSSNKYSIKAEDISYDNPAVFVFNTDDWCVSDCSVSVEGAGNEGGDWWYTNYEGDCQNKLCVYITLMEGDSITITIGCSW